MRHPHPFPVFITVNQRIEPITSHAPIVAPRSDVKNRHRVLVREAVTGVARAEESLIVVIRELGQARDKLLY